MGQHFNKGGRPPKINPATFRYVVRFNAVENGVFLTKYEKSGAVNKSAFIKDVLLGKSFKVFVVDQNTREFIDMLSSLNARYRTFVIDYDLTVKVELTAKTFSTHTTGKYAATRVSLLNVVGEALSAPDEVWLNNYESQEFNCYNYVKFYRDKAVNVVCRIENGKTLGIKTWFEIEQNPKTKSGKKISRDKDPRLKYRRGLLVKK